MSNFSVESLHPEFGAQVSGMDMHVSLSRDRIDEVHGLIDRYSFLCFPDQSFDDARQLALTCSLGESKAAQPERS